MSAAGDVQSYTQKSENRRELFGAVADLARPDLVRWLRGYVDGMEGRGELGGRARRLLVEARRWLDEL